MDKLNIINNIIRGIIVVIWIYLIYNGSLTLSRVLLFILVCVIMIGYNRGIALIIYIFERVQQWFRDNKEISYKIFYMLIEIHKWINPFMYFLAYTDKCLYKLNRYVSGTKWVRYNFIIYILMKYLIMFGLLKLILYKYYILWYNWESLTIIDILFKRMYGLILSVLIFTDIINYISHNSIFVYILIYYVLSIFCAIWELSSYYYNFISKFIIINYKLNKLNRLKRLKYILTILFIFIRKFDFLLKNKIKMNIIIYLRNYFTWIGRIIICLLKILVTDGTQRVNCKEKYLQLVKGEGTAFMAGQRIAYFAPFENCIEFKYYKYLVYCDLLFFDQTFELYWNDYKNNLSYLNFFKTINEYKHQPSVYIYRQLLDLAKLLDVYNQPINRLMNWKYYEIKINEAIKGLSFKDKYSLSWIFRNDDTTEVQNILNESEQLIVKENLIYLRNVDEVRAKLMYFLIWDIEYYYNNNNINYKWNDWIIQYESILEILIFKIDEDKEWIFKTPIKNKVLKFYDPEENMEFFNRLFNVLGILNISYVNDIDNSEDPNIDEPLYYVSKKFNNYNKKFVELMTIMYKFDFERLEENLCSCSYLSVDEIEISLYAEDYFENLRKEWEWSIKNEKLEERNWVLLKRLEELMV